MKKKTIFFTTLAFFLLIFCLFDIQINRKYNYDGENSIIEFSHSSSLLSFKKSFDTIFLKIDKKNINPEKEAEIEIILNGKKYHTHLDHDGDSRGVDDKYAYFSPIFLGEEINSFSYRLDSDSIQGSVEVITMNSKTYNLELEISWNPIISSEVIAGEEVNIISRSEWGADENYRYLDSTQWEDILKKQEETEEKPLTEWQKSEIKKEQEINEYLVKNYYEDIKLVEIIREENGHKLAWPIQKTQYIKGIVLHHTVTTDLTKPTDELVRSIYKYHSIVRGWGDLGYNYLIGPGGEIYEGRAGGDYTVTAHAKWNNRSNIGVALIGEFENNNPTVSQKEALTKLVGYLANKYGLDLSENSTFHKICSGECDFHIESNTIHRVIGHKDAGVTSCPGKNLYSYISDVIALNKNMTLGNKLISFNYDKNEIFSKNFSALEQALAKLEDMVKTDIGLARENEDSPKTLVHTDNNIGREEDINPKKDDQIISSGDDFDDKKDLTKSLPSFDETHKIKVKLSYPEDNYIDIKLGNKTYNFKRLGDDILFDGKNYKSYKLENKNNEVLEISSWERIPSWNQSKNINDNKFKGDISMYVQDNNLVVVNEVYLEDYLKGLGEINDTANEEKMKTIIIAARTYARWYMTQARKFPGQYYDGSDDPDVFQKYLGYSLEVRTPRVSEIVEETRDTIITYNGEIIKPWYFNQSNGKTRSYGEYCVTNPKIPAEECKQELFPFLASVDDPGCQGLDRRGHGVGISGAGAEYFATTLGRDYEKIIKYYLPGTEIEYRGVESIVASADGVEKGG